MTDLLSYETRRDTIVTHAWQTWTKNGLGLDSEDQDQTTKTVQDAVNNEYVEGIGDIEWLAATLARLNTQAPCQWINGRMVFNH